MAWLSLRRLRFARIEAPKLWEWFGRASDKDLRKATATEKDKLLEALRKLEGRDRIGVVADLAMLALGMLTGWGLAGGIAAALGFSSLITFLGVTVVLADTPLGVVIGSVLAFGLIAFLLNRLVRSGARSDQKRERLKSIIGGELQKHDAPAANDADFKEFLRYVEEAVAKEWLHPGIAARVVVPVAAGRLSVQDASARLRDVVESRKQTLEKEPA